jgi:hypothetical protein
MESGRFRGLGSDVACRVALKPRRVAVYPRCGLCVVDEEIRHPY